MDAGPSRVSEPGTFMDEKKVSFSQVMKSSHLTNLGCVLQNTLCSCQSPNRSGALWPAHTVSSDTVTEVI